jgi:hypothetical protein
MVQVHISSYLGFSLRAFDGINAFCGLLSRLCDAAYCTLACRFDAPDSCLVTRLKCAFARLGDAFAHSCLRNIRHLLACFSC